MTIRLHGRIFLEGQIKALTGLRIGGSPGALAIGGVDAPILRNPIDQIPYIPGSSLKGKMRSLWEKFNGVDMEHPINNVKIHVCQNETTYQNCPVCQIYGTLGQGDASFPTRIVVRDVTLDKDSFKGAKTDLPYSEVKWEAAIDRITSAATPRQIERVPAGAIFPDMQIVFNVYDAADHERFLNVLTALQLVEDDYLGGHGSRGSGRIQFQKLNIICKAAAAYNTPREYKLEALDATDGLLPWLQECLPVSATGSA